MSDAIGFSVVHPSRNRTTRAAQAIEEWTSRFSGHNRLEYIVSIDTDDADIAGYRRIAEHYGTRLLVNANRSLVDAVNRAAQQATQDLLVVVSDDFGCPDGWDVALAGVVGERRDVAVLVHDGIFGRIMTLPILGIEIYRRLGYVYHPDYFSMFSDDDLTCTVERLGKLVDARHLVFPHRHYKIGASALDETYARQNSNTAWWSGWRTFKQREIADFGFRPRTPSIVARQAAIELYYRFRMLGRRVRRALESARILNAAGVRGAAPES